jgi:integrase/recombinase XerC
VRAFAKYELHAFFAHCDDQVVRIRGFGRKGWLPAFRDATLFKTAYAFGLRRNETRMLDAVDVCRNVHGAQFGAYGVCRVRFGKAKKGSPPKQRSVLTVWAWTPDVLEEWFEEVRPLFGIDGNPAGWPSERGLRVGSWPDGHVCRTCPRSAKYHRTSVPAATDSPQPSTHTR